MDDRNEALNFHSQFEQHESTRIRDSFINNGHITEEKLPETTQVWTHLYSDSQDFVGLYDQRVRANLHHEIEYRPCTIEYPNDAS